MAKQRKYFKAANKYKMLRQNKARADESRARVRESERLKAESVR